MLQIKDDLNEAIKENLAHTLRVDLIEGDTCPVCGSTHHVKENIKNDELKDVTVIEEKIKAKEKEIKLISEAIIKYESRILLLNEKNNKNKEEIIKIEEFLKEASLEELQKRFSKLEKDLDVYKKERESTEKALNNIKNEITEEDGKINSKREVYANNVKQLNLLNKEITDKEEEFNIYENILSKLKEDTSVEDFKKKNEEITQIELKRNSLEKVLTIKKNIIDISELYKRTEERKNEIEKEYKDINEKLISAQSKDNDLTVRKNQDEISLSKSIKDEGFESSEDVRKSLIKEELLNSYKDNVNLYNENLSKIDGAIESLLKKIDDREISKEEYERIKLLKVQEYERYSKLNEEKIKCDEELKVLETKMNEQKELLSKRKELDHKISLLSDLDKLFKGKKFVEFVAAYQLKYVTIEASKRLKEITHGNFGIEVDENGRFIMRDYKNGGAERDASTLSGGETFLASLSLALALSAQIQLKGTAPLELFFLDEGFGTLDEDLLEVVMSSLERIHNDRLKVGIISHVESIKNRVPVKLVITPAECGVGGSKVRIERT